MKITRSEEFNFGSSLGKIATLSCVKLMVKIPQNIPQTPNALLSPIN